MAVTPSAPRSPGVVPLRGPVPVASVQGTLALELQPRQEPPRPADPPVYASGSAADVISIEVPLRRGFERWARNYAQAVVEIVGGDRPVSQVLRWTSREVYENLERRALLVARAGGYRPGEGRVQPVRPRVLGVHTCFVGFDVAEVSAHVRYGERSRAIAARFEMAGARWQCTVLEFA